MKNDKDIQGDKNINLSYYHKNKERAKEYRLKYYKDNKERMFKQRKEKYNSDPNYRKKVLSWNKKGREKNPEQNKQWAKTSYERNKEKISLQHKKYYQKNKEAAKIYAAQWYQKNKKRRNQREYYRYHNDPLYKITRALRSIVRGAFKRIGKNKPINTEKLMGCSWIEAKKHFESLFLDGMCWENYGLWEIDHIRPCSSFTEESVYQMNNINNLQPLWAKDNRTKSDKFI